MRTSATLRTAGSWSRFRGWKQAGAGCSGTRACAATEAGPRSEAGSSCTAGTRREGARGMHGTARSGTSGWGTAGTLRAWAWTLEDGAASRSAGGGRRCKVSRTRAGLRHDHAARGGSFRLSDGSNLINGRLGNRSCSDWRRSSRWWNGGAPDNNRSGGRNGGYSRGCGFCNSSTSTRWRDYRRRARSCSSGGGDKGGSRAGLRHHSLGRGGFRGRLNWRRGFSSRTARSGGCSGFGWRSNSDGGGSRFCGRGFGGSLSLFALEDGFDGVAGLGNIGKAEGWLVLCGRGFGDATGAGSLGQQSAHFYSFIFFDGAGVRLLLGHADSGQSVKDFLALDLKFPCQIVDANFAHSVLCGPGDPDPGCSPARLAGHSSLKQK